MVLECVSHHRKRPNPSDTDYYEPCQNAPEDNHDACSLPHVLEFTVAMRRFEELCRTAPWRRLLPSPVSEIAHEEPNALSCQSGLSTRAEALPDDADMRWRRAKRTAAMGGFAIQFGPCFPGSDAMTKVAQQHGSKGMADQRSGPNPWLRPKSWWAPL